MKSNFISSKDSDEKRKMHSKSNNRKIMAGDDTGEIIRELFNSLLKLSSGF